MGLLRFILAFAILVGHYKLVFPGSDADAWFPYMWAGYIHGAIKVNSFFLVSGFFTQLLLETKFDGAPAVRFYIYRIIRLLPVYYLCMALLLLLSLWAQARGLSASRLISPEHMTSPRFWATNIALYLPAIFNVHGINGQDVPLALALRQAWTLANEFALIVMTPFVLRSRKGFWWMAALSLALAYYYYLQGAVRDYVGATMVYFMLGAIGYKFYRRVLERRAITAPRIALAYGMVALIGAMLVNYQLLEAKVGEHPAYFLFMSVTALCIPLIAAFTRKLPLDRKIGELSYPMYLFQFMVFSLFEMYGIAHGFIYALAGVIVCALLAIRFVEHPLQRYRREKFASDRQRNALDDERGLRATA